MNTDSKGNIPYLNLIILAVSGVLFVLADSFNVNFESKLMQVQKKKINYLLKENKVSESIEADKKIISESTLENTIKNKVKTLESLKAISEILSVISLIVLAFAWFNAPLHYKFMTLFLFLLYAAGIHFIDLEKVSMMSIYDQSTKINKYILVRIFPALLFGLMFLTTVVYKSISKDKLLET